MSLQEINITQQQYVCDFCRSIGGLKKCRCCNLDCCQNHYKFFYLDSDRISDYPSLAYLCCDCANKNLTLQKDLDEIIDIAEKQIDKIRKERDTKISLRLATLKIN